MDAIFDLRGPDGKQAEWVVEARATVFPKEIPALLRQGMTYQPGRVDGLLVAAPFIRRSTREALAAAGISYCDTTGNLRLMASSRTARRSPWLAPKRSTCTWVPPTWPLLNI